MSRRASYKAMRDDTQLLIETDPESVEVDIEAVFEPYNLPQSTLDDLTTHLSQSPHLVDFFMQFRHCTEAPAASRALTSALTIAMGYFLGGLLPLLPYFFTEQILNALYISIGVMAVVLFIFGYVKTCIVIGWNGRRKVIKGCYGGVQMMIVGGAAAGAAMGLVKLFNREG